MTSPHFPNPLDLVAIRFGPSLTACMTVASFPPCNLAHCRGICRSSDAGAAVPVLNHSSRSPCPSFAVWFNVWVSVLVRGMGKAEVVVGAESCMATVLGCDDEGVFCAGEDDSVFFFVKFPFFLPCLRDWPEECAVKPAQRRLHNLRSKTRH